MKEEQIKVKEKSAPDGYAYCSQCDIYYPDPDGRLEKLKKESERTDLVGNEALFLSLSLMEICPLCEVKFSLDSAERNSVLRAEHPHMGSEGFHSIKRKKRRRKIKVQKEESD